MSKSPPFVVSIIQSFHTKGQKILEIGCGPAFLREDFGKDYTGTDITDEPYYPELPRDVDVVCPADHLLFKDDHFDIVVIKSAFFLFKDQATCLKEVHRVLKPGGKIILFDYNKRTQKMLQRKEGHANYPCWTQWGLRRLVKRNGFINPELLLPETEQPMGLKKLYALLRQEFKGDWAIVSATKK